MKYAIQILQERLDFLKGRLVYAKHLNDNKLEEKIKEKSAELEEAIKILQSNKLISKPI